MIGCDGGRGIGVRIAATCAVSNARSVFLPAVGDEFVLGFLGDAPTHAMAAGMLHASRLLAPCTPDDRQEVKGIVAGTRLQMTSEDVNRVTVIPTPGGQAMTFERQEAAPHRGRFDRQQDVDPLLRDRHVVSGRLSIGSEQKVPIAGQGGVDVSPPLRPPRPFQALLARSFQGSRSA